jgi:hypothetical protein
VFDSGEDFERITAALLPSHFNADAVDPQADQRSDNSGPEPEGIAVGQVGAKWFAFVGLERIGGVMVYDVPEPGAAKFVTYQNDRRFEGGANLEKAGDLGPEGILFVPAAQSPDGTPLLVVANEVSGTATIYRVVEVE